MKLLKHELIYRGKIFDLVRDTLEHENHVFTREYVTYPGAVTMVPFDGKYIYFVRQYRHPAEKELLELPAGKLEANESPEECAKRELQEEVGFIPGKLTLLARFYTVPGYSKEFMYLYLAEDLRKSKLSQDRDEFLQTVKLSVEETVNLLKSGGIEDAKTIIGIFYLLSFRLSYRLT